MYTSFIVQDIVHSLPAQQMPRMIAEDANTPELRRDWEQNGKASLKGSHAGARLLQRWRERARAAHQPEECCCGCGDCCCAHSC